MTSTDTGYADGTGQSQQAVAAAQSAATATAELLRYAREGACATSFNLEPDTLEQLADALRLAIEIEFPAAQLRAAGFDGDVEGKQLMNQLHGALERFLEGWA